MLVAIVTLVLGAYLIERTQQNSLFTIGFALLVIVFGLGFAKQLSSGMWNVLLANKQALYIIASANGKDFLQVPWQYLQKMKLGMHGLNRRGLIISINSSLLDNNERDLIRHCLNVTEENASQIYISVPTGIVNRDKAIQELDAYKCC